MTSSINVHVYSDALVLLGTAGVVIPLIRRFGFNPVLGYLGAGAILGPLGLGSFIAKFPFLYWFTVVDPANVSGIANLGVVFLLFLIGMELSYDRLKAMHRLIFGLGSLQIVLSTVVIGLVAALAGSKAPVALIRPVAHRHARRHPLVPQNSHLLYPQHQHQPPDPPMYTLLGPHRHQQQH